MSKKKNSNLEVEFRKVPSLLFLYEVSEDGRIVRNVKSKHHLKFDTDRGGYYRVRPFIKGKQVHVFVHILVAECWLGKKPEGYQVDHIDRNRKNNHRKNLRYVTPEENRNRRVFSEEGKRRNSEITKARYFNATDERKKEIIRGMRDAWINDDGTLRRKQIEAVKSSWKNASDDEKKRWIGPMLEANKAKAIPISIRKDPNEEYRYFDSKASGAKYLSEKTGIKFTTICGRLNARRKYIGEYEIRYHK